MIINFTKLSPGGNDTIIVQTPVASDKRALTACELMNRLGGEQVGYLALNPQEGVDARLDSEWEESSVLMLCEAQRQYLLLILQKRVFDCYLRELAKYLNVIVRPVRTDSIHQLVLK